MTTSETRTRSDEAVRRIGAPARTPPVSAPRGRPSGPARRRGRGPVLGPGPVAETFPEPLAALEAELWVGPLRRGLIEALRLTGAASRRRLARSPVVVEVGGRVAVDLGLLGGGSGSSSLFARVDPRGPLRRLGVAWRVGRLRAALPQLAGELIARADADLGGVDALGDLDDRELLDLLHGAPPALAALHGLEMLAGLIRSEEGPAASSLALRALAEGRAAGWSDAEIRFRRPVVLSLTAPAIGEPAPLAGPGVPVAAGSDGHSVADGFGGLVAREALRLRIRWIHELTARAAWELGRRLAGRRLLAGPEQVALLTLAELRGCLLQRVPQDLAARRRPAGGSLPAAFRLDPSGAPVAVTARRDALVRGLGVSPGRGVGPVHNGPEPPPEGAVLVVPSLDPRLAAWLPGLAGLVSETGSALSHVAIVAREWEVPVVVGVAGACEHFRPGMVVTVDGTTGDVHGEPGEDR